MDILNYQIYSNDAMIDESQFELEITDTSAGQIQPDPSLKLEQVVPPGTSRSLSNLRFTSRDDVKPEGIVVISMCPVFLSL